MSHTLKLTRTGARRLEKTAAFLDKLPSKYFDLKAIREERKCGTVACVIGHTPEIFPRLVKADGRGSVYSEGGDGFSDVAADIFQIPFSTALFVFTPDNQDHIHRNLPVCGGDATPKRVARMLRKFIAIYK